MAYKKIETTGNYWNPEKKDDQLEGEIIKLVNGEYGTQYEIKKENGEIILTPSHKVLQNRMAELHLGDKVKIVFTGEELPKVKGQNPTKMYDVFVDE